jgi:hypothetical protein
MVHDSVESRDVRVSSGMEEGIIDSCERLGELVAAEQVT